MQVTDTRKYAYILTIQNINLFRLAEVSVSVYFKIQVFDSMKNSTKDTDPEHTRCAFSFEESKSATTVGLPFMSGIRI